MSKYQVDITEFGHVIETIDELFDSYKEAEEAGLEWISDYSAGADVLALAGEAYGDPNDVDFEISEVD